jgi:hypothetical protein
MAVFPVAYHAPPHAALRRTTAFPGFRFITARLDRPADSAARAAAAVGQLLVFVWAVLAIGFLLVTAAGLLAG